MEAFGHINAGKIVLAPEIKRLRDQYLASLPDGCVVRETITKVAKPKSYQQVKAFFGLVVMMAKAEFDRRGVDCMGVALSEDMVKQVLYHYCAGVGENGKTVTLSNQSMAQACDFFENCRTWLAQFGVIVPDPDPAWREKRSTDARPDMPKT